MRNKKLVILCVALFNMLFLPLYAQAGNALNGDEIKALFTDKTFDGTNTKSGWMFKNYASSEGACVVHYTSGKKSGQTMNNKWFVDGDTHCCDKGNKKICGTITNEGDGVYHKMNKSGKHIQTFSNFADGNQL